MITLLLIVIFSPVILLEICIMGELQDFTTISITKKKLEKNGYFVTKDELKNFNKYLIDFFGVDITKIKIIVFSEKVKIFKLKDNYILADGMTLKVIANESEMLTYLENKKEFKKGE